MKQTSQIAEMASNFSAIEEHSFSEQNKLNVYWKSFRKWNFKNTQIYSNLYILERFLRKSSCKNCKRAWPNNSCACPSENKSRNTAIGIVDNWIFTARFWDERAHFSVAQRPHSRDDPRQHPHYHCVTTAFSVRQNPWIFCSFYTWSEFKKTFSELIVQLTRCYRT